MKKSLIPLAVFLIVFTNTYGQSFLDKSFANHGHLIKNFGGNQQIIYDAVLQADGKILMAGEFMPTGTTDYDISVFRINGDGTMDNSFGNGGLVIIKLADSLDPGGSHADFGISIISLPSGKIRVADDYGLSGDSGIIVGLNNDGTRDFSFAGNGYLSNYALHQRPDVIKKMIVDNSGNLIVAGNILINSNDTVYIERIKANGQLDSSFGFNGIVSSSHGNADILDDIAIDSFGRILATGHSYASAISYVCRYTYDGQVDSTFGTDGVFEYYISSVQPKVAIKPNGHILFSMNGQSSGTSDFQVLQLTDKGVIDTSFANYGLKTFHLTSQDYLAELYIADSNDIYISGTFYNAQCRGYEMGLLNLDSNLNFHTASPANGLIYIENYHCSCSIADGLIYISPQQFLIYGSLSDSLCNNKEQYAVKINFDTLTSINVMNKTPSVKLFPNPNSGFDIAFSIKDISPQDLNLSIIDITGQNIFDTKIEAYDSNIERHISLPSDISSGTYIVKVKSKDINTVSKLIIERH